MEKHFMISEGECKTTAASFDAQTPPVMSSPLSSALTPPLPIDLDSLDETSLTSSCHGLVSNPCGSLSDPFVNTLRLTGPLLAPLYPTSIAFKSQSRQRHNKMKRKPTVVYKYCEEMNELNEAANSHPRSALIQSIQQENKHIRELQKENKDMRLVLEEHQNILELIMVKHRDQIKKLLSINKKKSKHSEDTVLYEHQVGLQVEQIHEMVAVMRKAAQLTENENCEQNLLISSLMTENKGLREMLQIADKCGSVSHTTDSSTQTDDVCNSVERDPEELPCPNNHIAPLNGISQSES